MSKTFFQIKQQLQKVILSYRVSRLTRFYLKGKYRQMAAMFKKPNDHINLKVDQFPFVYFLISEGNQQALKVFVENFPFKQQLLIDDSNPLKSTPICFAVLQDKTQLVPIFEQIGANLQTPNSEGQNLLHISAIYRRNQAFEFAIKKGVNKDFQDFYGNTPFHYACRSGIIEMITTMVTAKAQRLQNKNFQFPIHMAIQSGNFNAFLPFLSDLSRSYPKFHPIHSAARSGNPQILIQILKQYPLSINYKDFKGLTPLHHAVIVQDDGMVKLILRQNQVLINEQDDYGNTPLHLAIINNNLSISEIIIKAKANLDIKNKDFMSPIDYGLSSGVKPLIKLLNQYDQAGKQIKDNIKTLKY